MGDFAVLPEMLWWGVSRPGADPARPTWHFTADSARRATVPDRRARP
ncbi:hypothetical protein [Mycolicibacterium goodii]